MALKPEEDAALARQARTAGLVIAVAMVVWIAAQIVGPRLGWAGRYAFFFDLAAMAAFIWSLIVAIRIWRRRREG